MRISDWSSDVCSSDLPEPDIETAAPPAWKRRRAPPFLAVGPVLWLALAPWLALERTSLAGPSGRRGQAAGRSARVLLSVCRLRRTATKASPSEVDRKCAVKGPGVCGMVRLRSRRVT